MMEIINIVHLMMTLLREVILEVTLRMVQQTRVGTPLAKQHIRVKQYIRHTSQ